MLRRRLSLSLVCMYQTCRQPGTAWHLQIAARGNRSVCSDDALGNVWRSALWRQTTSRHVAAAYRTPHTVSLTIKKKLDCEVRVFAL